MRTISPEPYPFGKRFAVSLVDDTDQATLSAIEPVYQLLATYGILTTKTVWPLQPVAPTGWQSAITTEALRTATLQDCDYRKFCLALDAAGFEIAMHTASGGNNVRARTLMAYQLFEDTFGRPPATNVMHGRNLENLYWGKCLPPQRLLSQAVGLFEPQPFFGHDPSSPYYWGDICKEKTRYVRGFETLSTDTLEFDPATPYHDPEKPDVNWWFSTSNGVESRLYRLLGDERLQSLMEKRGACIVHFYAFAVVERTDCVRVKPRFEELCRRLSTYSCGWFAPVASLLDRLRATRDVRVSVNGDEVVITNSADVPLDDFALNVPADINLWDEAGRRISDARTVDGQVPLGRLDRSRILRFAARVPPIGATPAPSLAPNYWRLAAGTARRLGSEYWHGRRGRVNSDNYRFPRL